MIVPTMTLEEIFKTVQVDLVPVTRKLSEFVRQFGKAALKINKFPFKRKYEWKNYKSNITYTIYLECYKRSQWDNPRFSIVTSYMHDGGLTTLQIDPTFEVSVYMYTAHFWSRFRERYIKDSSKSLQEIIDFFFFQMGQFIESHEVMRIDYERYQVNEDTDFVAIVTSLGVFYCERLKENNHFTIVNTYLSYDMLRQEQNRNICTEYLCVHMEDYVIQHPNSKTEVDKVIEEFCTTADSEGWPTDKFFREGGKLMEKYPLYLEA